MKKSLKELSNIEKRDIITKILNDVSIQDICDEYNITSGNVTRIMNDHMDKIKNNTIEIDADELILEIAKHKEIEHVLLKSIKDDPKNVTHLLKIQERITELQNKLKSVIEKNNPDDRNTLQSELLKLKIEKEKGHLIPRTEIEAIIQRYVMTIQIAMTEIYKKSNNNCECLKILQNCLTELQDDEEYEENDNERDIDE